MVNTEDVFGPPLVDEDNLLGLEVVDNPLVVATNIKIEVRFEDTPEVAIR